MGLKNTLRKGVKKAFEALDDIPKKVTYQSVSGEPVRDLETGSFTRASSNYTLPMVVFTSFTTRERDKDPAIETNDVKVLFPSMDLPVKAKTQDTIIDDEGVLWEVIDKKTDPASVVTILQMRAA